MINDEFIFRQQRRDLGGVGPHAIDRSLACGLQNPLLFHHIEKTVSGWKAAGKRAPGSRAAMRQMMVQSKSGSKGA